MVKEYSTYEKISDKSNFSEWYNDVLSAAGILDMSYDMKGMFVWLPYGLKMMRILKSEWDKLFQSKGIEEMYFPLIVPMNYCTINNDWWEGFKDEGYKVIAGKSKEIQGALRPTGEPAIYPMFSKWIRSKNDLPIRIYETVSSFRYETKQTRPLIRDREITNWFEIHTAHATKEEAERELELHVEFMDYLYKEMLALPPFRVHKPRWEVFPGAVGAYEYYSLMPDGKVMENGSANNLGQAYAKKFDIKYKDENGNENYCWMICTGNGGRFLAAAISEHGDNKGLVLPPKIAPIQVVIVPIVFKGKEKELWNYIDKVKAVLEEKGIRYHIDSRDISPGRKFNDWEVKGVPIRLDIGPKNVKNNTITIFTRFDGKKKDVSLKEIKKIDSVLDSIHNSMLDKATKRLQESIVFVNHIDKIKEVVESKKIAKMYWCGSEECYDKLVGVEEGYEGFGTDIKKESRGVCACCGKPAQEQLFIARSY